MYSMNINTCKIRVGINHLTNQRFLYWNQAKALQEHFIILHFKHAKLPKQHIWMWVCEIDRRKRATDCIRNKCYMQNHVRRGFDKWHAKEQLTGILIAVARYWHGGDNDASYDEGKSIHCKMRPRPRPHHPNIRMRKYIWANSFAITWLAFTHLNLLTQKSRTLEFIADGHSLYHG